MLLYIVNRHLCDELWASILVIVIAAIFGNAAALSDNSSLAGAVTVILLFGVVLTVLYLFAVVKHLIFVSIYLTYTFYWLKAHFRMSISYRFIQIDDDCTLFLL